MTLVVPPDPRLTGMWRRTLLVRPDGTCDVTSSVTWVQAGSRYVDLRLPRSSTGRGPWGTEAPRADPPAPVEGFAGTVRADGTHTCWDRLVDLHPDSPPDEGLLELEGSTLVETGRHVRYLERWRRADDSGGFHPPAPSCAIELREPATGVPALLVRVGDSVGWARARCLRLPAEIALGVPDAEGGVLLSASNLPGRAGARLDLVVDGGSLVTTDTAPDGTPVQHRWDVVAIEGPAAAVPVVGGARSGPFSDPFIPGGVRFA